MTNFIGLNDAVKFIDFVAKSASLLYSISSAILLRVNKLPKLAVASPPPGIKNPFLWISISEFHSQS